MQKNPAIDLGSHEYSAHLTPVVNIQEDVRLQEAKEQLLDGSFKDTKK